MASGDRSRALPPVPMEPLRDADPRELGGFRLLGRLGAGGMGVAFLAEGMGQWAVVKMIRPDVADDGSFRVRLARELDAMSRAGTDSTAAVLASETDGTPAWFAMEFIPGVTLARRVEDSGPLPTDELAALATGLAQALQPLHAAGVVHRDIKPANIMLSPSGPRIIDFGIADLAEESALTRTGIVLGSTGWLAPEQVRGDRVTPATDVHAWGLCVLFAATGVAPLAADNTTAAIYRVLEHTPDVPESVPSPLRDLVVAALDKDPLRRPPLDRVLERLVAAVPAEPEPEPVPVAAPPVPPAPPARPAGKRPPWLIIGAAAGAVVVVAALALVFLLGRSGSDEVVAAPTPSASTVLLTPQAEEPTQGTAVAPATPAAPASPVPAATSAPPVDVVPEVVASPPVTLTPVNAPADDYTKPYGSDFPIPAVSIAGDTRLLPGDTVGLYAGTKGEKELTCDRSRLADSFESGSERARVWAQAMGVSIGNVRDFLYALTPVLLRADTLITIHGYAGGRDTTTPAVLQAGTAVLVTPQGEPLMRCFGSNPLSPTKPPTEDTTVAGEGWTSWDPDQTVMIEPAARALAAFDLADVAEDRVFTRPVGVHGTQDVWTESAAPGSIP